MNSLQEQELAKVNRTIGTSIDSYFKRSRKDGTTVKSDIDIVDVELSGMEKSKKGKKRKRNEEESEMLLLNVCVSRQLNSRKSILVTFYLLSSNF